MVSENKPKLDQLGGAPDAAPAKGKPGKGTTPAADSTPMTDEDMLIGDAPVNNFFVGDAVE